MKEKSKKKRAKPTVIGITNETDYLNKSNPKVIKYKCQILKLKFLTEQNEEKK